MRITILFLGSMLIAAPAHATTFRVDAQSDGSTIVERCNRSGPCCNACHVGQPAAKSKTPPKHDRALYGKHLQQIAEGQKLKVRGDSYVTKEKGQLVLYEGKQKKVLPPSTLIVKDAGGRTAILLEE